ncbi:hypothetical protein AAY473_025895 [Plecturocebus cupreus]
MPVIPEISEAKAGGWLEARSLRPAWETQQDPISTKNFKTTQLYITLSPCPLPAVKRFVYLEIQINIDANKKAPKSSGTGVVGITTETWEAVVRGDLVQMPETHKPVHAQSTSNTPELASKRLAKLLATERSLMTNFHPQVAP